MGPLKPADLRLSRLRYVDPVPYPPEEFARACEWMGSWGLIRPGVTFNELVDNRIALGP